MTPPPTRADRRAATADRIRAAAQVEFGEHGLEATTVRAIARRAGVDPSLVIQHYGTKDRLFAVATTFAEGATDEDAAEHLHDVVRIRMAGLPPETRALMRSMLTAPEATEAMKAHLDERTTNLTRTTSGDDAELRAALAVSGILGLTIARHFLRLDALAELSDEQITRTVGPWIASALAEPDGQAERPGPAQP